MIKCPHVNPPRSTSGNCKLCRTEYIKQRCAADPEYKAKRVAQSTAWQKANKERHDVSKRAWNKRNKASKQRSSYEKMGVNPDEAISRLALHSGKCDCCGGTEPGGQHGSWNIDHDHNTGHIRGVLCSSCNTGIGLLGDSLEGVLKAATYLGGSK